MLSGIFSFTLPGKAERGWPPFSEEDITEEFQREVHVIFLVVQVSVAICCGACISEDITWLPEQPLSCGELHIGKLYAGCILIIVTWLPEEYQEVWQASGRDG